MRTIGLLGLVCYACLQLPFAAIEAADTTRIELPPVFFEPRSGPALVQTGIDWGEIRVAEHDAEWVAVSATVTPGVDVQPVLRKNELELRVEAGEGFHSIELEILVPRGTSLALEVRRGGEVLVDGAGGAVEVSNRNGSVALRQLRGAASVHARNGSIDASFDHVDGETAMAFSTLNGSVDVSLPAGTAADLSIRYNRGGVESDFVLEDASGTGLASADVSGLDPRETRVLRGRINGGGPRYYFETANGTVYLRRGA